MEQNELFGAPIRKGHLDAFTAKEIQKEGITEVIRLTTSGETLYQRVWRTPENNEPYIRIAEPKTFKGPVRISGSILFHARGIDESQVLYVSLAPRDLMMQRQGRINRTPDVVAHQEATKRRQWSGCAVADVEGIDTRPDPLQATSAAEFIEAMREFRLWAGDPSFRDMSGACDRGTAASTFHKALASSGLPRLKVVEDFVRGCGGDLREVVKWATSWRQLALRRTQLASGGGGQVRQLHESPRSKGA